MDKFLKAIELADHPEKFSDSELEFLLEDPEIREIYDTICQVASAFVSPKSVTADEVNALWSRFTLKKDASERRKWLLSCGRRSVAAVVVAITSVTALAFGIGFVSRYLSDSTPVPQVQTVEKEALADATVKKSDLLPSDSTTYVATSVIFENETLGKILKDISQHYGLSFEVINDDAMNIRLYYRWNTADEASDVVRQLNSFDRIRLILEDDILILK
ncbi:MAG: hypothetical protein K2G13_07945 [Muribaculaceae bacterium]|nr:hypothetical protein [Muribaculaceae bacterium]